MINNSVIETPCEACGIVASKNNSVVKVFAITNADKSPTNYLFDSKEHYLAIKEIEDERVFVNECLGCKREILMVEN